jgi:acyl carrier protein
MNPDTRAVWTREEIRATLKRILADSLGVDQAAVTGESSLVRDLGAESIDFLDIGFTCQQEFGVDLPARLIQERILDWRGLGVLARVIGERYGLAVPPEELRTIAPSTAGAVVRYLRDVRGLRLAGDEERDLAMALARRLLQEFSGMGLALSDLAPETLGGYLVENLHSPAAADEVLNRFTVGALGTYLADQLRAAGRLAEASGSGEPASASEPRRSLSPRMD